MKILGVDLSSTRWEWTGTALLTYEGGACTAVERGVVRWPAGSPTPDAMAAAIRETVVAHDVAAVAVDGPQGWRDPARPADEGVGRRCERATRTPGKTGWKRTYPANYLGWTSFSIDLFDRLLRLPAASLDQAPTGGFAVVECFPTSTWRAAGLSPLPAKGKRPPVREFARRLCDRFALPAAALTDDHDELQGVVAALAAAAAAGIVPGASSGLPAYEHDGSRVEGLIWDALPSARPVPHDEGALPMLVLVTGAPGAGKSTVGRALADRLGLPLIAKDGFKEALFGSLAWETVEATRQLGAAAWDSLAYVVGELLRARVSVVVEGNFTDARVPAALPPARIVEVHLTAPPELLLRRYLERPRRHPGHQTEAYAPEIRARVEGGDWRPLGLPGTLLVVDTSGSVDLPALARDVSAAAHGGGG